MLAVDRGMFGPAMFAAASALRQKAKNPFDLIVAVPENDVPPGWIDHAERQLGVCVREVPFRGMVPIDETINRVYPPSSLFRYFFDRFLDGRYKTVVYLDGDVEVDGDISVLFGLNLEDHLFAAVPDGVILSDVGGQWRPYLARLGLDPAAPYANTGVLVLDRARWAAQSLSEQLVRYLRDNAEACALLDQSALNAIVRGSFQKISPVWNMLSGIWFNSTIADTVRPVVYHYSGAFKPWQPLTWRYDPAIAESYRKFYNGAPWPAGGKSSTVADLLKFFGFRRRAFLRRLRGRPVTTPMAPENLQRFKDHLRSEPFADLQQGLTVWRDGKLSAV